VAEFGEDLALEDEDSQGMIAFSQIVKLWRINGLPQLDEELTEFLFWLAMRHSEGSERIYIQKFLEIFQEDYVIQKSMFDDKHKFNPEQPPD
jgi:hypothetical protein